MALSTSTTARWTILSSSAGTPSGRGRPSAFGMYALRTGFARYALRWSRLERSCRFASRFSVVPPRLAIDASSRITFELPVGCPQPLDGVHVVKERGEPLLPVSPRCLPYPLERAERAFPALRPARVTLGRVPLGQPPSLHHLRGRFLGVVRWLPGYYEAVRLPAPVHHRRVSSDFPMRPAVPSTAGRCGTSRFPGEVHPYMRGVFDRAGSWTASRSRRPRCGLPRLSTASAPRSTRRFCSGVRDFAAQYPACTCPCQRFTSALTGDGA